MVQYNKNIINKKTIHLLKQNNPNANKYTINRNTINRNTIKKVYGGNVLNTFWEMDYRLKILVVSLITIIIYTILSNFFRLKMNGVVFPLIFGYFWYQIYVMLMYHTKKLGINFSTLSRTRRGPIRKIIDEFLNIMYSIPKIVPVLPLIEDPTFNDQPFKGLREGIRSLKYPYRFKGENYKLTINFPKLEIPFLDPLAGICCVWEKLEKLIKIVQKAIQPPLKIVKKIFAGIKKLVNFIKNKVIRPILNSIKGIVGTLIYPIIGLLYVPIGFLEFILAISNSNAIKEQRNKMLDIIKQLQGFANPGLSGGNLYNTYKTSYEDNEINNTCIKYSGKHINDPFYKIEILEHEEEYKEKLTKKKITKMSIFKMYNIQKKRPNGLPKYINAYKDSKFKSYAKAQFDHKKKDVHNNIVDNKGRNHNFIYYNNKIHTYRYEEIPDLKKTYEKIINDNNYVKNKGIDNYTQYGGGLGDKMRELSEKINFVNKIKKAISDIPKYANIICVLVKVVTNGTRSLGKQIERVAKEIFGPIPEIIKKIGKLIVFVYKVIEWFINSIIAKGIRIIQAAVELVFKLSLGNLPASISTKIFEPIKVIFTTLLSVLKLPFLIYFTTIVEILTDIPRFFNLIADILDTICKVIESIVKSFLKAIIKPAEEAIKNLRKAIDAIKNAMKKMKFWGGSHSISYNSKLNKIFSKHYYELNIMLEKRHELQQNCINNKYYLNKIYELDKLIKNKKLYIKKIKKILLEDSKKKLLEDSKK